MRWRFPIAFQILPLIILLGVVWFFPESPRWLAKEGRNEEARYVLNALRGSDGASGADTQEEFNEIIAAVKSEKWFMEVNGTTNYWSMMTGRGKGGMHITRRTYLIIWLQIIQEWVGVAGVTVYAPVMFRAAGEPLLLPPLPSPAVLGVNQEIGFSAQMANLIAGCNNVGCSLNRSPWGRD